MNDKRGDASPKVAAARVRAAWRRAIATASLRTVTSAACGRSIEFRTIWSTAVCDPVPGHEPKLTNALSSANKHTDAPSITAAVPALAM